MSPPAVGVDINGNGTLEADRWPLREISYYPPFEEPMSIVVQDSDVEGIELVIALPGASDNQVGAKSPTWLVSSYPNPARRMATVSVDVVEAGSVTVDLIDLLGRKVSILADGFYSHGRHDLSLDVSTLPAGIYLVRLRSGGHVETRSALVVR